MKKLRVTVEGKTYEVLVETVEQTGAAAPVAQPVSIPAPVAAPIVAPAPAPAAAPMPVAGAKDVASPLAGKVVSVEVKVGQTVAAGDQLMTIEAMKMNTHIFADNAGKIAAINVAAGDAVNEGQALISFA